jgi:GDPmannose 4,6-dehydratase
MLDSGDKMKKKALVLGATGQDGSYLCELLLEKGYETHGLMRRSSSFNTARLDHIFNQLQMHYGDLTDGSGLDALLVKFKYDEIYSLAAQSHVKVSFDIPEYTCQVGAMGTLKLLEAVRAHCPDARVYNASSSEMFGSTPPPQSESTVFHPRSPYGCAKVFAHNLCVNYREAYGMHVSNGILFNHESPRRGETFVTHKITKAAARISVGLQKELALGNLDAKRDWGHAQDYVEAMWLMLQQPKADDYVIATGKTHTIRELLDVAFGALDLDWKKYVTVDPKYFRATEVDILQGDATKARIVLGWKPKWSFKYLIEDMVAADRAEAFAERGISLIDQQ